MSRGWLQALRAKRRAIARAMAVVLLFPTLLALLPPLTVSAAAALERDLAQSVCGQPTPEQGGGAAQHSDHDHCILAGASCPVCAPSSAGAVPAFDAVPILPVSVPAVRRDILPPTRPLLLRSASPPRGPPASFSI